MVKQCSIIFDLDGTLWDALSPITLAWNEAMAKAKMPYSFSEETVRSYMGLTPEETGPLAFPGCSFEEQMRLFRLCVKEEIAYLSVHPGKLYPKERETLAQLSQRYSLYLVSNSDKGYVENYLSACQMEDTLKIYNMALGSNCTYKISRFGAIAQLGERLVRNEEVAGPIPVGSTKAKRIRTPFAETAIAFAS
jgi:phosphoglycolate phosphatase